MFHHTTLHGPHRFASIGHKAQSAHTFKAFYAVRSTPFLCLCRNAHLCHATRLYEASASYQSTMIMSCQTTYVVESSTFARDKRLTSPFRTSSCPSYVPTHPREMPNHIWPPLVLAPNALLHQPSLLLFPKRTPRLKMI